LLRIWLDGSSKTLLAIYLLEGGGKGISDDGVWHSSVRVSSSTPWIWIPTSPDAELPWRLAASLLELRRNFGEAVALPAMARAKAEMKESFLV
jgi:hypothetical protein